MPFLCSERNMGRRAFINIVLSITIKRTSSAENISTFLPKTPLNGQKQPKRRFFFCFVYFFSDAIIDASRREGARECLIIPANEERGVVAVEGREGAKSNFSQDPSSCHGNGGMKRNRAPLSLNTSASEIGLPQVHCFWVKADSVFRQQVFFFVCFSHRLIIIHSYSFTRDHYHLFIHLFMFVCDVECVVFCIIHSVHLLWFYSRLRKSGYFVLSGMFIFNKIINTVLVNIGNIGSNNTGYRLIQ